MARETPERYRTARPTVPELEEMLQRPVRVLDHGFVRVIDYMGGDAAIVQAARVSYGAGTRRIREDEGLIRYLLRNSDGYRIYMCEIKFHVKLPIFVARQWIRHRTANVNEYSARYSILDKEFYVPSPEMVNSQSQLNRQGRGGPVSDIEAGEAIRILNDQSQSAYNHYVHLLNEDIPGYARDPNRTGLARELARISLSLNYYTQWYWKIDLHNLFHFLKLRLDHHAQAEIREYAKVIDDIVKAWVPLAHKAFTDYVLTSLQLSSASLAVIRALLAGEAVDQKSSGLALTEYAELLAILGLEKTSQKQVFPHQAEA